jgi:hypothetical protein
MFLNQFKSSAQFLKLSFALLAESDTRESGPDREQLLKKIKERKRRSVPVGKFILLLAAIILTVIVLEYFI